MNQTQTIITDINIPELNLFKEGKVRSVFDLGDQLLIVASDRVSAFDFILPSGIPNKGSVLTRLSNFWFDLLENDVDHHLISTDFNEFPQELQPFREQLEGRSMLVKKTELIPIECVVRGYIVGSGWKDYQKTGQICGIDLPEGLQLADQLPEPIFTPAFKAEQGDHDENISFEKMKEIIGDSLAEQLKEISLNIYKKGHDHAKSKDIILADTKFEFGLLDNKIILIDEVLTPDSSRYWERSEYKPGISPPSFDKQIVRDHLENSDWDKQPPAPTLPTDVIESVSKKYLEVEKRICN